MLQQINISYKGERLMNFSHYKSRDTEGVFVQLCSIASSGSVWSGGKRLVLEIDNLRAADEFMETPAFFFLFSDSLLHNSNS